MSPDATPSQNGTGGEDENWDDVDLDEEFVRSAETSEPSARNRMLTARWRHQGPPEPQPWRSDQPPAGWFFSRARRRWWKKKRG